MESKYQRNRYQKTHLGRTAGGWVKYAKIVKTASNDYLIMHDKLPNCELMISRDYNLVIHNYAMQENIVMPISDRGLKKLSWLQEACEKMYESN